MARAQKERIFAFAMVTHPRVGKISLPEVLMRQIVSFVGLLPTVEEALSMSKKDLARIVGRKKGLKNTQSTLIVRVLCPLLYPSLSFEEHRAMYREAVRAKELREAEQAEEKKKRSTIQRELAQCHQDDVCRIATLTRLLLHS